MKLHLGCGKNPIKGFVNCDIQDLPGVDKIMDCADLRIFENLSADLIFAHSFFEHLYCYQHSLFLSECKRVMKKEGLLFLLGIPDFEKVCDLYLNKKPGIPPFGGTFNLYQSYRLTHGDYEGEGKASIPQLHKALFDKPSLWALFKTIGFNTVFIFNYTFPKEQYKIPIGIIASKENKIYKDKLISLISPFKDFFDNYREITALINEVSPTLPYIQGTTDI